MTPEAEDRLWWTKFWIVWAVVVVAVLIVMVSDYRYANRERFTGDGVTIARRTVWALQNAYLWESGRRQGLQEALVVSDLIWSQAYWDGCLSWMREVPCDEYAVRNMCSRLTSEARKP